MRRATTRRRMDRHGAARLAMMSTPVIARRRQPTKQSMAFTARRQPTTAGTRTSAAWIATGRSAALAMTGRMLPAGDGVDRHGPLRGPRDDGRMVAWPSQRREANAPRG